MCLLQIYCQVPQLDDQKLFCNKTVKKLTSKVKLELESVDKIGKRDQTIQRVVNQHNPETKPS